MISGATEQIRISADGATLEVNRAVIRQSLTLEKLWTVSVMENRRRRRQDDGRPITEDEQITLNIPAESKIDVSVFQQIIQWMNKMATMKGSADEKNHELRQWVKAFWSSMNQGILLDITMAALYLRIEPLVDCCCALIAMLIAGMHEKQIRVEFNLSDTKWKTSGEKEAQKWQTSWVDGDEDSEALAPEKRKQQLQALNMSRLPNELLPNILRRANIVDRLRAERVNSRWERVALREGWSKQTRLDADTIFRGVTDSQRRTFKDVHLVAIVQRAADNLTHLDLDSLSDWVTSKELFPHLEQLPKLTSLSIAQLNFRRIVDHLPRTLRELRATGVRCDAKSLAVLSTRCPALDTIHLHPTNKVSVAVINSFLAKHPRLKKLTLGGSIAWYEASNNGSFLALDGLAELEELVLELNAESCGTIDEEAFCVIVRCCHRLKKLSVRHCLALTDDAVRSVFEHCKSLIKLDVYGCQKVTKKTLKVMQEELQRRRGEDPGRKSLLNRLATIGCPNCAKTTRAENEDEENNMLLDVDKKEKQKHTIFHFNCGKTGISTKRATAFQVKHHRWVKIDTD